MGAIDRDRWLVLEPLLDRALELTGEERSAWLVELREHSPELAEQLTSLISVEADVDRRGFLAAPLDVSLAGLQLGAYTLDRPIGHGGMGSVWLAHRSDGQFEGRAAVKLLNLSLLSATGQARFRREGSVLARLAHPNVARLLDAGVSPGGQPYLVLEYVDGVPIDEYVRRHALPRDEVISLLLRVMSAVGHAHANLIVHRDLKPSNVLVATDGTPKLLDFGIAKLLDDGNGLRASLTESGRVLTPEFAAPEQARGDAITTATDVYALGVILYLLLSGRHPTAEGSATPAAAIVALHEVEPARLGLGDLDTIVLKALRKAPQERYQTVAAFADDLTRFLRHQPVAARPDSLAYRARKFVRRNRAAVAAAAVGVVLLAGAGLRERALRSRFQAEARKAEAVEQYLVSVFSVADPLAPPNEHAGDVTARALLDRGAARIDSALAGAPETQAELRAVLGGVYSDLGLYDRAEPVLRRALAQRRALYGPRHPAVAEAMDLLGRALVGQDRYDQAEPLLREALAMRRQLLGDRDSMTAVSITHVATLLQDKSDYDGAEPLFREALAVSRATQGDTSRAVADALTNLGLILWKKQKLGEADSIYRVSIAIHERTYGADHAETAITMHNLAQLAQTRGNFVAAESLYRRALAIKRKALGNVHPSVSVNLNNLGNMLARDMGRVDEAEPLIREALAIDRQLFGEHHGYYAASLTNLGHVFRLEGQLDSAERAYRQALAIDRALYGPAGDVVAYDLTNVGAVLVARGDFRGSVPLFRDAREQYRRMLGDRHASYLVLTSNLARSLRDAGDLDESEPLWREVLTKADSAKPALRPMYFQGALGLGKLLTMRGRRAEARPWLERAVEMARTFGPEDMRLVQARLYLAECLAADAEYARAEPLLRDAYAVAAKHRRDQPRALAEVSRELERLRRRRPAS